MKVCVFGSGGIGAYFGARLVQAGIDVTFVARGDNLSAMQSSGLKVSSVSGDFQLTDILAVDNPKDNSPYDLVILAVKSWQVEGAAEALKGTLAQNGTVLPLQNGVETPDILAGILGADHVILGLCGLFTFLKAPGHVCHAGVDPYIQIGERDGSSGARIQEVLALLNTAKGLKATAPDDIRVAYWMKFMFIVTMSGVGAITRAPMGVTRELDETRALMKECAEEVFSVGCAQGVKLPADAVDLTMKMIDSVPAEATASMQRDIIDGKPSELFSQNSSVTRLGRAVGVATPVNRLISTALLPQESRARGRQSF